MSEIVIYRIAFVTGLYLVIGVVIWAIRGINIEDLQPPGQEKFGIIGWIMLVLLGFLIWIVFGLKIFDGYFLNFIQN